MMLKNVKMPIVAGGGTNSSSLKSALRRGFTIMELVIVIAVIAVLAAVLIPTFANLTERANESADLQTVENLNTILRADETIDGEKPATMQEALEHALSGGYNVSALTPTSDGNSILWNQEDNRFVLADSETGEIIAKDDITTDTTATGYKYWAVVGDRDDLAVAEANSFSRYYTSADVITDNAVSANAGVDVSALETAVEIEYTNTNTDTEKAQDVIINGNGGALTVNADTDTVSAYGVFSSVDGKAVADESLHIYAEVTGNISIADGRLVIETGSSFAGIVVTATAVANVEVVINDASNLGENSIVATDSEVAGALTTIVSATVSIDIDVVVSSDVIDEDTLSMFAGGLGTESSPYQIATAEQFKAIAGFSSQMVGGKAFYFSLINDIDLSESTFDNQYMSSYFYGELNGNNHNLITNDTLTYVFADAHSNVSFVDINYYLNEKNVMLVGGMSGHETLTITFDDVDIYTLNTSTIIDIGENEGLYYGWTGFSVVRNNYYIPSQHNTLTIQNCDVYVNLSGTSYNAVFVGGGSYYTDIIIEDCTYNADYYGALVNLAFGNTAGNGSYAGSVTVSNVVNNGGIYGTSRQPMVAGGPGSTDGGNFVEIINCNLGTYRYLQDNTLAVSYEDNKVVVHKAASNSASYYVLTLTGGTLITSDTSENSSFEFSVVLNVTFDNSDNYITEYTDGKMITIEQYAELYGDITLNDEEAKLTTEGYKFWMIQNDGVSYYVFDFENDDYYFATKPDGTVTSSSVDINTVSVMAYDESNLPIAQVSASLR